MPRASFTPRELATLTIEFYRRNYIEGLFVSSGVVGSPDYTMELMIETIRILRFEEGFRGYIHAKSIPGASQDLVQQIGMIADRLSVNIELPSQGSLDVLAPEKAGESVVQPMRLIHESIQQNAQDRKLARKAPLMKMPERFAPAGQSTQMIVGATPETDHHILKLSESFYRGYGLKRVFFSAYSPVNNDIRLPSIDAEVPLTREHRLYQADWLLRFYGFEVDELLTPSEPDLALDIDPKASWALQHPDLFPLDVNRASYEELLRVPGIGVKIAQRIVRARRDCRLTFDSLAALGLSFKRAGFFIVCSGKYADGYSFDMECARRVFVESTTRTGAGRKGKKRLVEGQLSLFDGIETRGKDTFAAVSHRDRVLDASRAQMLKAHEVESHQEGKMISGRSALTGDQTPSGLPAADPLLLQRFFERGADVA